MEAYTKALEDIPGFTQWQAGLRTPGWGAKIYGLLQAQKSHFFHAVSQNCRIRLIITHSEQRQREIYEALSLYDKKRLRYPAKDLLFFHADLKGKEQAAQRIEALRRLYSGQPCTIVSTFGALMARQAPWEARSCLSLRKGEERDISALEAALASLGYSRVSQVEDRGQFARRGGLLDIYDLTGEYPCRLEWWGEEIDSIRYFDISTQRSLGEIDEVEIGPATEMVLDAPRVQAGLEAIQAEAKSQTEAFLARGEKGPARRLEEDVHMLEESLQEGMALGVLDAFVPYFYPHTYSLLELAKQACGPGELPALALDEPDRCFASGGAIYAEFLQSMEARLGRGEILPGQSALLLSPEEVAALMSGLPKLSMASLEGGADPLEYSQEAQLRSSGISAYKNNFAAMAKDLADLASKGYALILFCASRTRGQRLAGELAEAGVAAFCQRDAQDCPQPGRVMICYGYAAQGFLYQDIRFGILTEADWIGGRREARQPRKKDGAHLPVKDFHQLSVGDYVVHERHGVGIYQGLDKVEVEGVQKDFLKIAYKDGGKLYVPATALDAIQKYMGAGGEKRPVLSKLGGAAWEKSKQRARAAVEEMARDLVELYAAREQKRGYAYGPDTLWQKEFEELFPHQETQDQWAAIEDTKRDMESPSMMDRLICGDVGFGKTEIAIRAAFKAVQENKQVAYLVPTTILAQQHYYSFCKRMGDFPVRVGLLSRFCTPKQIREVLEDLQKGYVDIVIGTHRLLSKDVRFHDLGLLIVDEEQRFGVSHKEKIKKWKEDVDVLTLSATPIPRTLHMSLAGIRKMSLLEEPPQERQPIQTYVMEYNPEMVREAIQRELGRGGQVYYVCNRIQGMEQVAGQLSQMLPEARVRYAHGQMPESQLEEIMMDFVEGEIDVLVSTTIIETGLDISNVNTILVQDADRFGLAQLYQLRGRVGRSDRLAYAFLLYKKDRVLREVAQKRLEAIKEFTDLGSGFRIAMRDLEIRGAGNLLGKSQHGHMEAIGYELYCRLLRLAVSARLARAGGEDGPGEEGDGAWEGFSAQVELAVDAFIPPDYIPDEIHKLDMYKRIAGLESDEEREELEAEMQDRYGKPPQAVKNLLRISLLRVRGSRLGLLEIKGGGGRLAFIFSPKAPVRPEGIPRLVAAYKKKLGFTPLGNPTLSLAYALDGLAQKDGERVLQLAETLMEDVQRHLSPVSDGEAQAGAKVFSGHGRYTQ